MKKMILSVAALATMTTTVTAKSELATLKAQMAAMNQRLQVLETQESTVQHTTPLKAKKYTKVKSKAPVLQFSGKHYLGFVSDKAGSDRKNYFETRRNYFQVKAYFQDAPKSYFRMTLDTHHIDDETKDIDGTWNVRLKYAYLYLDNILPYTGVEIGQAHRPWIDYEEHGGWNYRSISKVFVEAGYGAHLTNSADLGVNFKTKTEYFSSELGIFNGEGYHGDALDGTRKEGLSSEWRLTGHLLGGGTKKGKKKNTYANVSFLGQWNDNSNKHKEQNLNWYGMHAVYNQPNFLLAAQYIKTEDADDKYAGKGWSINGTLRPIKDWSIIARYDNFELDTGIENKRTLTGVTYQYNKNIEFIISYLKEESQSTTQTDAMMLSTEVNW